jgi:hypothetical protein
MPPGLVWTRPSDRPEQHYADDRHQVPGAFPIEPRTGWHRYIFMTHRQEEHPRRLVGFVRKTGECAWPLMSRRMRLLY